MAPALIIDQWELDSAAGTASVGSNPATIVGAYFGIESIVNGGAGAMGCNRNPYAQIPHVPAYALTAFGATIYGQVSSLPATPGTNRQIVNKDATAHPNGWSIEQRNVGGVSRLGGYIRNDAGSAANGWFDGASMGTAGVADLPLNIGFQVTITFDPAESPKCRMFLRLAGGAVAQVASIADNGATTLANNGRDILVAIYNGGGGFANALDGAVQRLILWSGAPTLAQLGALPAPQTITISPPVALAPIAADFTGQDIGSTATTKVINPTVSPSQNAAAATVSVLGTTGPVNNTPPSVGTDQQTITIRRNAPSSSGAYTVTYRLTTAAGADGGQISGTIAAAGTVVAFNFVTRVPASPIHTGFTSGLVYNPSDPMANAVVDQRSGIPMVKLGGANGQTVRLNGSIDSGLKFPRKLMPENLPDTDKVWNADQTLVMVDRYFSASGDATPTCKAYIMDVDGSRSNRPWQILRAGSAGNFNDGSWPLWWVWDPTNPLRAYYVLDNGAVGQWYPIGGDGHTQGWSQQLYGAIGGGFNGFTSSAARPHKISRNGRYMTFNCRNSNGEWGGFRFDLQNGSHTPFIRSVDWLVGVKDEFRGLAQITPNGQYAHFNSGPTSTGLNDSLSFIDYENNNNQVSRTPNGWGHNDRLVVNNVQYSSGAQKVGGVGEVHLWGIAAGTNTTILDSVGPTADTHTSARNWRDTFEAFGGPGTQGVRYVFVTKYAENGGIYAVRTVGPKNVFRFIGHHRSKKSANSDEAHWTPSPFGNIIIGNSNLRAANNSLPDDIKTYAFVVPIEVWRNPNNDGRL